MKEKYDLFPSRLYTFPKLNDGEKIFFAKIIALVKEGGGETIVTNEKLAEILHKDVCTIKRYIKKIEKLGLIKRETKFVQGCVKERTITITEYGIDPSKYLSIPAEVMLDDRLGVRTKGVFAIVLSCNQEERNMQTVAKLCGLNIQTLRKEIAILEKFGYLKRTRVQNGPSFNGWKWEVYGD